MSLTNVAGLPRLQTRIGAALGVLILIVALVLAMVLSGAAQREALHQSAGNLESMSAQMSRELSGGMDRFLQAVVTQTYRDRFRDPDSSIISMRSALDEFKRANPEFAYVSIVDVPTATVIAASGGIFEGGNARGRPTFDRGISGPFVGDVHDAVRLAELLPKSENGEALRFLDVSAPIADRSGKIIRVFATHVAWQWTEALRKDIFGPVRASSGVDAFLVDTAGKVVLSPADQIKVGTDLTSIIRANSGAATVVRWQDGADYLTVVSETAPHGGFPGFGWKVVAREPRDLAEASARNLRGAFLLGALVLGLSGALLAWLIAGRLMRPVKLLAEAAMRAQAGDLEEPLPRGSTVAEIAAIEQALARQADTVRQQADSASTSRRQFTLLADSLPEVVFQADARGTIEYVNKAWIRHERGNAPFNLADLEKMVVAEDCELFTTAWRSSLATGEDLKVRCRILESAKGAPRWYDIEAHAVVSHGQMVGWVGTLYDVHDMVSQAEETERALEQERAARIEAENLARLRDEFLATVSHELRSPLSAITGWSDVLRLKGDGNPMMVKAAAVIRRNAELQAALINDLLDITAVMGRKLILNTEPVDLSRVANDVVLSQLRSAQTKGVALVCSGDLPVIVDADRRRITQVLSNLVGNAIKFTEAAGSIEVDVSTEGGRAMIAVRDTGRGIAPRFLPHVFERMRQEDSSITRRAGGLGLGLAIVKGLVDLHHGTVVAQSDGLGRGSVFTVSLPLSASFAEPGGVPAVGDPDEQMTVVELQGRRVLLVDDEPDAREVAHVALSSLGAEVRLASSGAEALELLASGDFDALVSDVGMPDMDGLTLIRKIRAMHGTALSEIPAVALTAFAMESDRRAGIAAGFQAYVTKPISLRRLSEAVAHAIASHQASRNTL